jgi:uncharacterized RDD family membrane protein YckC
MHCTPSTIATMNAPSEKIAAPASLFLRLLAGVYDLLPMLALWFIAVLAALALTGGALDVHRLGGKLLVQALVLASSAAYCALSWTRGGQTIGMKPWRLRVVRADGMPVDTQHALLRFIIALISLAALGAGFWWALIDARGRTWHDIASGTVMVRMDK